MEQGGLDAAGVRRWAAACVRALEEHRAAIDAINVYPVPDADTGTNMLHTVRAGFDALLRAEPADAAAALRTLSGAALSGARGNSGVLIAQVLRGFADVLPAGAVTFTATDLPAALTAAATLATEAISEPVPGTILTVLDTVATALRDTPEKPFEELTGRAVADGTAALAATRTQLAALNRAGVVDAGAHGLVLVLVSLHNTVTAGEPATLPPPGPGKAAAVARKADALLTVRERGADEYQYEVMYLLAADQAGALAETLRGIGDSVSVAGDGAGSYTVHVHCNDVGAAIEAGIETGRPHRITVARFADQVTTPSRFAADRAVVTIARGPGVAELFRAEGAAVLTLSAGVEPTASDVLAVITGTRAATVTVLSNEPELAGLITTGAEAARHAGQSVTVIPTMSPVQGLAALAVHDPDRRLEDDVVAMAEAAAATRRGALVIADQEALTWAGRCVPGDVLGMVDGEVVFIRPTLTEAGGELIGRMLGNGGELVTALLGAQATGELADTVAGVLRERHPEVELAVYTGDQHDAVLVIGVE